MFGTEDGLATVAKIEASKSDLPPNARFVPIEGGIHAFFGDYGSQSGDGTPTIDRTDAQAQIVAATLEQLDRIEKLRSEAIGKAKQEAKEKKLDARESSALEKKSAEEALTAKEIDYMANNRSNQGYHYYGSAKTLGGIGKALAEAGLRDRVQLATELMVSGKTQQLDGQGNGPIDAFVAGLAKLTGTALSVVDYHEHAISAGSDAKAVTYIELKIGKDRKSVV